MLSLMACTVKTLLSMKVTWSKSNMFWDKQDKKPDRLEWECNLPPVGSWLVTHPPQAGSSEGRDTAAAHLEDNKEKSGSRNKNTVLFRKSPAVKWPETDEWLCHIFAVFLFLDPFLGSAKARKQKLQFPLKIITYWHQKMYHCVQISIKKSPISLSVQQCLVCLTNFTSSIKGSHW